MTTPTAAEQTLIDTVPQRTKLYLSIYRPQMAMMLQAGAMYDGEDQELFYDTVLSGSTDNIHDYDYQVALIGTTPGADDLGRTWVRSAYTNDLAEDQIRFVESDHVEWTSNCYVTILKYTEIIPVYPRIIQNPADDEDVIFYKVWDIAYTDQNEILGSFICMGSHYAGFLTTGSAQVYFSASGTYNLLGENLTYAWTFEGATTATSSAHTPGNITWTAPGHYRATLEVTSTSGRVDRSIRNISIYNRTGSSTPIQNWEFMELSGSRDGVGYTGRVRIRDTVSRDGISDNAMVIIFKEDWYGATKQSISRNDKGRENILFVGYINGDTIHQNYVDNYVEFEVLSPTNLMEQTECFSVSVESVETPTKWYELLNMDVRRAVYHYLAWHSSVPLCCDIEAKNLDDRSIQFFDADRTSLYDAINSVVEGALYGRVVSDSLGKIWLEREAAVIDAAESTLNRGLTIYKQDWIETPIIDERQVAEVSFLEAGGIAYQSSGSVSSPYLAVAPGSAPGYHGKIERLQGFALSSQNDLNELAGNLYAYWNSRYPNIEVKLWANCPNLDIAPQEKILLNIAADDTPRGIVFVNKAFALRGVSWIYDAQSQTMMSSLTLAEIVSGFNALTLDIPIEPVSTTVPGGGGGGGVITPPPPVIYPPPASVSGTAIDVYDNGEFILTTTTLNFIGSFVRVFNNNGRADIMIDGCCTGTA